MAADRLMADILGALDKALLSSKKENVNATYSTENEAPKSTTMGLLNGEVREISATSKPIAIAIMHEEPPLIDFNSGSEGGSSMKLDFDSHQLLSFSPAKRNNGDDPQIGRSYNVIQQRPDDPFDIRSLSEAPKYRRLFITENVLNSIPKNRQGNQDVNTNLSPYNASNEGTQVAGTESSATKAGDSAAKASSPTPMNGKIPTGPRKMIRNPTKGKPTPSKLYPPGITFFDVPKDATIQGLLSIVRVPSGRIRMARLGSPSTSLGDKTKIFFADWPAHTAFLENARSGKVNSPWNRDLQIVVDKEDVFRPAKHECLENTTRILRIEKLPVPANEMNLDIVLQDLVKSSGGVLFQIEKGLLFKSSLQVQLNFTSIQGAVLAKDSLTKSDATARKYQRVEVRYMPDECSAACRPIPPHVVLEWRGLDGPKGPDNKLMPAGYLMLPLEKSASKTAAAAAAAKATNLAPTTRSKVDNNIPLTSNGSPEPAGSTLRGNRTNLLPPSRSSQYQVGGVYQGHKPYPTYPSHGLFIERLPISITYSVLLSSLRGGKIYQANIFSPKRDTELRNAGVFFTSREDLANVLGYLRQKGGLWICDESGAEGEGGEGKRYPVRAFPMHKSLPPPRLPWFASRCVCLRFDDVAENRHITAAALDALLQREAKRPLEVGEQTQEVFYTSCRSERKLKGIIFNFASINMAFEAKRILEEVELDGGGGKGAVKFQVDGCEKPVEGMK
ncbi:MAG: hypothetical protein M1827_004585 [Pycnora praestabilis]|nr:MAG: hypothetical protein M1827_004585 [Pycnora praestabilis]